IINIRFNNILDGFDNYKYIELSPINNERLDKENEENFIKALEEFYDLNEGNLIIDFYKNKLNYESINFIKNNLSIEDNILFEEVINEVNDNDTYYKVNNKIYIKLLTKLCTRELFFITFYFYKYPITIWGNYNLRFPLFYNDIENISKYIKIAQINKLY
ncbi:hypothetical protein, partial [Clostridium sp.]